MTNPDYEYHGLMAKYWDLLRGDTSHLKDRAMYLDVIKKYGQPVLDVGCSTGRLLLEFLSRGIDADGVDISPEMTALCERNAQRKRVNPPRLFVQDMAELDLPRKYKTILVPSSSFQLLVMPDQPMRAMNCFYEYLEPGGALVIPFMSLWREGESYDSGYSQEAVRPEDNVLVRRSGWSRYNPETKMESTYDTWELVKDGVIIESHIYDQSPAAISYTREEAVAFFEQAGFKDIQVYSEFTFEPVKPDDTLYTILGIK